MPVEKLAPTSSSGPIAPGLFDAPAPALWAASPDFALGILYLIAWVAPLHLGEGVVRWLVLAMVLEFIIIHSSAFAGTVMAGRGSRPGRVLALTGLTGFYLLFVVAFAASFHTWWPVTSFMALTLNRMLSVLLGHAPEGAEKEFILRGWAASVLFYLGFCFVTIFLPLPLLGMTRAVAQHAGLPGTGLWVEQPHRVMAFGFLYFTATGWSELVGHRWIRNVRSS
jgi:hypothetical protein